MEDRDEKLLPRIDRTPRWRILADRVLTLKEKGISEEQILKQVTGNPHEIMEILQDEAALAQFVQRTWSNKIPTIKSIMALSLKAINDTLKDISEDEALRKQMLCRVTDLQQLTKVVTELNTLMRLELGESTTNVAVHQKHTYEDTRGALQELKKLKDKDPVFGDSYPEEPDAKQ